MDSNQRFDQLESLLVDLARKQDHQTGQLVQIIAELQRLGEVVSQQGEAIARQGQAIVQQGETIARLEVKFDNISEQIGDIINILKISEARHTQIEQRQDIMLVEIQRQGQRQDAAIDAIKALLKRQENTDSRLDGVVQAQLQTLQLMRVDADKIEKQEPRITRLEDEVFRAAS